MLKLNESATHCPICESAPVESVEEVLNHNRVFLRCPKGHPYVACGDDQMMAISNWNHYVSCLIERDTANMFVGVQAYKDQSYCRSCQRFTLTKTRFEKVATNMDQMGYSIVIQNCETCTLEKSRKDGA